MLSAKLVSGVCLGTQLWVELLKLSVCLPLSPRFDPLHPYPRRETTLVLHRSEINQASSASLPSILVDFY